MEKQIRESTLAREMPELVKGKISKANKKNRRKFAPKYRTFSILQNKIEDVVKTSTHMWKLIYGQTIVKEGEEDPFEGRNNGEEYDNDKEGEDEKEKADDTMEKENQKDDMATAEE